LISHGFFKSLLFLQIGYVIHIISNIQDPRMYGSLGKSHFYLQVQIKVSLFALCGQMFSNGIVTKEAILNLYVRKSVRILLLLLFIVRLIMTFFYSYRLWVRMFKYGGLTITISQSSLMVKLVSYILRLFSIVFMWWLNLNLSIVPSFFVQEARLSALVLLSLRSVLYGYIKSYKHRLLISKFYSDYFLIFNRNFFISLKFIEIFKYRLNNNLFGSVKLLTLRVNLYMKGINYTILLIIILLVFLW
jgi:NADH:ubiquinone oxidoreductase subunit 5 (subunit L)/multisubunit Na+/H+ antiporter MnhA subunit